MFGSRLALNLEAAALMTVLHNAAFSRSSGVVPNAQASFQELHSLDNRNLPFRGSSIDDGAGRVSSQSGGDRIERGQINGRQSQCLENSRLGVGLTQPLPVVDFQ